MIKNEALPVVATAELNIPLDEKQRPKIAAAEIKQRAYRACPIGSAACGFSFESTQISLRNAPTGTTHVNAKCGAAVCGMTGEFLQAALSTLV